MCNFFLKKETGTGVLLSILRNFQEHLYRTPPGDFFWYFLFNFFDCYLHETTRFLWKRWGLESQFRWMYLNCCNLNIKIPSNVCKKFFKIFSSQALIWPLPSFLSRLSYISEIDWSEMISFILFRELVLIDSFFLV